MNARWMLVLVLGANTACQQGLTREEAKEALDEARVSSEAMALTSNTVEITTNFTIGGAAAAALDELRAFYASQLPCAEVTLDDNSLSVEYGVNGTCLYRGQAISGSHQVTVSKNEENEVIVDHVWENLSNNQVEVNGTATVTWNFADPSRHVQHNLEWTRLSDGRTGTGSGDRIQRPLAGGIATGFSVDGERHWEGEAGNWDLQIDAVEMRWVDPVPQAGTYVLDTPFGKQVSMSFERVDAMTIKVTVENGRRSFDFDVVSLSGG